MRSILFKNMNQNEKRRSMALGIAAMILPCLGTAFPHFGPPVTNPFGFVLTGSYPRHDLVDIDDDGDLDLFTGLLDGSIRFYENTTVSATPAFALNSDPTPFGIAGVDSLATPEFADINGDGDFDLFVGTLDGPIVFFENSGSQSSPAFAAPTSNPFEIRPVFFGVVYPTMGDIDGDGDLDLVFAQQRATYLQFNIGNSTNPQFGYPSLFPPGYTFNYIPDLVDIDGDGDLDFFAGGPYVFAWFMNMGMTPYSPLFKYVSSNPRSALGIQGPPALLSPEFADLDGDGDLDALIVAGDDTLRFFPNTGINDTTAPSTYCRAFYDTVASVPLPVTVVMDHVDQTGSLGAELFVKRPGETSFSNSNMGLITGSINTVNFFNTTIDGDYEFYTVGRDAVGNLEAPPSTPDTVVRLDSTPPTINGPIVLLGSSTTEDDVVCFEIQFSEMIGTSFGADDIALTGTLSSAAKAYCDGSTTDPTFKVCVVMDDPDADGTIGIHLGGIIRDLAGNYGSGVSAVSDEFTIQNFPPGDVSKDGVFDLADVALLADANLSLTTLP